jgi:hypothetical protein
MTGSIRRSSTRRSAVQQELSIATGWYAGGAVGGFFLGTLLCGCGAILALSLKGQLTGSLEDVLLGGFCISIIGGIWGLILGLTDQQPFELTMAESASAGAESQESYARKNAK